MLLWQLPQHHVSTISKFLVLGGSRGEQKDDLPGAPPEGPKIEKFGSCKKLHDEKKPLKGGPKEGFKNAKF